MPDPKYETLLDRATWDFVARTLSFTPAGSVEAGIGAQRESYDAMCAAFHAGRPPGVFAADERYADVPVRVYETGRDRATVVYLHGGGFVLGGLESHDDICAEICATGLRVMSVDYRLAPEHPHPAAYDDALVATLAIAAAFGPVLLVGDSAGGALAASVLHAVRATGDARGAVLVYPGLGGDTGRGSMLTHAEAPLLSRADVLAYQDARFGGATPIRDVTSSVLSDQDVSGLPPVAIFAAECDPLADDGLDYAKRIRGAGGDARYEVDAGLVHGWLRARHSVPRAARAFARILSTIEAMA